jgi:HPr kinase/phosphorylase
VTGGVERIHASCVAIQGRALLILGPSGAGKSSLALQMMALGADLVSDDQTLLTAEAGRLIARAPAALSGLIEARFVGLLNAPAVPQAEVVLAIDLAQHETERLPPTRTITFCGITCALAYSHAAPHLPASLICYLGNGRRA